MPADYSYNDYLDKLTSKIKPKKIIAFDIETSDNNQKFLLGDTFDGALHKTFYEADDMKKYLIRQRHPNTYIIATNLQFDFTSMIEEKELAKCKIISKHGRFMMCAYSHKDENNNNAYSNKFIDSLNHYAMSVEDTGKFLGLPKLEKPEFLGRRPLDEQEWKQLIRYNQRDTEITYKLMTFLQAAYNEFGCCMRITISSTAMDLYRRKYIPCNMIKESCILDDKDINKYIFRAYYGGRTEVFKRGLAENIKFYDVNSLYPYEMTKEYPLPQSVKKIDEPVQRNIEQFEGVSDVQVYCPYMKIPLLPYRDETTKKLIFPVGIWRSTYTHAELRRALELGYEVRKIYRQIIYEKTFYPFKNYVEELYKKRMEYKALNSPMDAVVKLLLNSLYGKFGQRDYVEQQWYDLENMTQAEVLEWFDSDNTETFGTVGYYRRTMECKSSFVFPILPAMTTAYGRIDLHDYIIKNDAYYCDTDSIMTKHSIEDSKALGKLKLEQNLKRAIIIRPKLYLKEDEQGMVSIKTKGVPIPKKQADKVKNFMLILNREKVYFEKFTKLNEAIRQGLEVNGIRMVDKTLELEDSKRAWFSRFNPNVLDAESEPHGIDERPRDKNVRIAKRLTNYEKYAANKLRHPLPLSVVALYRDALLPKHPLLIRETPVVDN